MVAVPLIARGRGVAVLYADPGEDDGMLNVDALETLVRVAGLTVELLASSQFVPQTEPHSNVSARRSERTKARPETESFDSGHAESSFEPPVEAPAQVTVEPSMEASAPAGDLTAGNRNGGCGSNTGRDREYAR